MNKDIIKKLPLGLSSIEEILEKDYIYVDKTRLIRSLIEEKKYHFLSRPRRFGKSLLLSTLSEIFQGNKELFKGCEIYNSDYAWEKHPVVHLDFAAIKTTTPQDLENSLKRRLEKIALSYNVPLKITNVESAFEDLIEVLGEKNQVVVLVDEYDKPLLGSTNQLDIARKNREILKEFLEVLKSLDRKLKFVFITGISKFSQVSLFSGLNNLSDITINPKYATLLGYTEEEIRFFFGAYIEKIAGGSTIEEMQMRQEKLIASLREWYNGYRFSSKEITVYNPHSVLSFFDEERFGTYWFRTGTPSFLVDYIQEHPQDLAELSKAAITEEELCDIYELDQIELLPLMWQTGYLTIQNYHKPNYDESSIYYLDFPNREVRKSFFDSLMRKFTKLKISQTTLQSTKCRKELEEKNLPAFFKRMVSFFALIPYHLFRASHEGAYHAIFLLLLEAMQIRVHPEDPTNTGRIDLTIELSKVIYVFEFKKDKNPQKSLSQIDAKRYLLKYGKDEKDLVAVGVNFSSKTRNISSWKAVVYDSCGVKKETLHSEEKV